MKAARSAVKSVVPCRRLSSRNPAAAASGRSQRSTAPSPVAVAGRSRSAGRARGARPATGGASRQAAPQAGARPAAGAARGRSQRTGAGGRAAARAGRPRKRCTEPPARGRKMIWDHASKAMWCTTISSVCSCAVTRKSVARSRGPRPQLNGRCASSVSRRANSAACGGRSS